MSAIARFLQIQYEMNKVSVEQLQALVGVKLTQEDYSSIVGEEDKWTQ